MKQAISEAVTNRKGGSENEAKSEGEKPAKPPPGGEAPSRRSDSILCSSLSDPYASEASSPFPNNDFLNFVPFLKFPCFTKPNEQFLKFYIFFKFK
jgi:hypothetical protein